MKATKKLAVELPEDMFYTLKSLCVTKRMTMTDFTLVAIDQSMKRYLDTINEKHENET